MTLTTYEHELLKSWEEIYKKGQLTFWILLALKDSPKHMAHIKTFISNHTNGTIIADDQSMYRALRRYHIAEMVDFTTEPGQGGPERKVYALTPTGQHVLNSFSHRNLVTVLYDPLVQQLITRKDHDEMVA